MSALRKRLAAKLALEGYEVFSLDAIHPAMGWYRSSPLADTTRWEASGRYQGIPVSLSSYDTMTECAKNGVTIEKVCGSLMASARSPRG